MCSFSLTAFFCLSFPLQVRYSRIYVLQQFFCSVSLIRLPTSSEQCIKLHTVKVVTDQYGLHLHAHDCDLQIFRKFMIQLYNCLPERFGESKAGPNDPHKANSSGGTRRRSLSNSICSEVRNLNRTITYPCNVCGALAFPNVFSPLNSIL